LNSATPKSAPQTKNANDGLYSEWQVKLETLKGWSKTCLKRELTPTQFENSPAIAPTDLELHNLRTLAAILVTRIK